MVNLHTPFLIAYVNEQLAGGAVFRYRRVSAAHARIGVQLFADADNFWHAEADVANINVGNEATLYAQWQEYGNPRNLVPSVAFDMSGMQMQERTQTREGTVTPSFTVVDSGAASPYAAFFGALKLSAANARIAAVTVRVCDYNEVFCVERGEEGINADEYELSGLLQLAASLEGVKVYVNAELEPNAGVAISAVSATLTVSFVETQLPQPNPATVRAVVYVADAQGVELARPYDGEASVAVYDLVLPSGIQDVGAMVLLP